MKKALIAWLLCLVMLLGMGVSASAEGEWRNILLLGNDTRTFDRYERSDVMIIISINEAKGRVKLTSIMRDTDAEFVGGGSGKINGAMAMGGPEKAMKTISKAFDIDISEYIVVDFHTMMWSVDHIGGVDIEITDGERNFINTYPGKYGDGAYDPPLEEYGLVHLEGWQALSYSRDRKSSPAGDFDRVKRQRKMLIALLNELQEMTIDEAIAASDKLIGYMDSNISDEELLRLGKFALTIDTARIDEFRLPADGTYKSGTFNGVYKIKPNLEKNRKLLKDFINGVDLKQGSQGESVRKLQEKLIEMGVLDDKADGVFGQKTAAAVKKAQEKLGLEKTGVANEDFLDQLYA